MSLHLKNRSFPTDKHIPDIFIAHKGFSICIHFIELLLFTVDDIVSILKINILCNCISVNRIRFS